MPIVNVASPKATDDVKPYRWRPLVGGVVDSVNSVVMAKVGGAVPATTE